MNPSDNDETEVEADRRRAVAAAQTWYPTEGGLRDYVAVALFAATLIGAAMLWSGLPAARTMLGAAASDRTQFFLAYGSLVVAPALGWASWWKRRNGFAIGFLVLFGLAVAALLPVAQR